MPDRRTEATLYRWSEVLNEQLNPSITRQYITGSQAMFARLVLTKGCIVPTHSHPNEQIAYIAEGSLKFTLGYPGSEPQIHIVNAGEMLVIPADLPHSAEALEDTIDFDIFSPPRQDWIDKNDSYLR
ncbi:MAG TPA: cupin domain-containing protein [Granulicella sp.]|jgi:quercetin dioxygenase-like cupin family protein|nr:cupin domain-containing protein [Granulicella sp.]